MARGFIKGDRNQIFLLPPSVDDWVSKDHPVRFVQTCLEQMNLQSFYESYASEGRPPYDPRTMLGILVYAYSKGLRSSRKISKACEDEIYDQSKCVHKKNREKYLGVILLTLYHDHWLHFEL